MLTGRLLFSPPWQLPFLVKEIVMITSALFGSDGSGRNIMKYTIRNRHGESAVVLNYGAALHELHVLDRDGNVGDILLGEANAESLSDRSREGYTIGRVANRISGAACVIEDREYAFEKNARGEFLHSGSGNYAHKIFDVIIESQDTLLLRYEDPGEAGFTGKVDVQIRYTFGEDHRLIIRYRLEPEETTLLCPTNHSYFNLGGYTDVRKDMLKIDAERIAKKDECGLPYGETDSVEGTIYDFRVEKKIAERTDIDCSDSTIRNVNDFYCLDGTGFRKVAVLKSPASGRIMETWTDMPSAVLYVPGNCDNRPGKNGIIYPAFGAVCIECQYMANAVNCEGFAKGIFHAGEILESTTAYCFGTYENERT